MRVHSYVITTDRGSAPNYDGKTTTLAICKPRIRKRAAVGDLVIAFNGKTLSRERNSVRWAGIVSEVMTFSKYWADPRFECKKPGKSLTPDNIYEFDGVALHQVLNESHDHTDIERDLSGQNVLVFKSVWHLGTSHEELNRRFERLYVGGTRRHEPQNNISQEEWVALQAWLNARVKPADAFKRSNRKCGSRPPLKRSNGKGRGC